MKENRITGGFSLCAYKYAARYGAKVTFTPDMLWHQFSADLHNDGAGSAVICNLMGHKSAAISLDCVVSDGIRAINHRNAEKHELIQESRHVPKLFSKFNLLIMLVNLLILRINE